AAVRREGRDARVAADARVLQQEPPMIAELLLLAAAQGPSRSAACTAMKDFKVPGIRLEITKTDWVGAGSAPPTPPNAPPSALKLPAFCRVDGVIDRRTGGDGKPYGVGFAVALPDDWNGRFLQQGGGGLNGTVGPPLGRTGMGGAALAHGLSG